MALTKAQRAAREGKIGTSFFNILMKGDAERIENEWLRLVGDPSHKPFRLSRWQEMYGAAIEPVAIDYWEEKTQCELTRRGEQVIHPHRDYVITTLDCWRTADSTCLDVKGYNAHYPADQVLADVYPQLTGAMGCTGALGASVLLVHGGGEPQEMPIKIDDEFRAYEKSLWHKVDLLWDCVVNLIRPVERTDLVKEVIPPEQWRRINLDNEADRAACNWAGDMISALNDWRLHKPAATKFEFAKTTVKQLLPDDVGKVIYDGITVSKAKNFAVTIR